jgi:formylglycine-generating enzyme required for sulfatase activity
MPRFFCITLIVLLASHVSIQAQTKETPKYATNSLAMKFVWIRPGTFTMGSPKQEKGRSEVETQHTVELTRGFYMGVYTVTQDQWYAVMADGARRPWEGFDLVSPSRFNGGPNREKNLPVENVSWNDCQAFLKRLAEKEKKAYRLPTEAEWEYSCRAGTATPFSFGETLSTEQANYSGLGVYGAGKKGVNRKRTTPVGSFAPNAWGLYDMHGNVAQWCQDRFANYPQQHAVDPQGPEEEQGSRVLRGGCWEDDPARCRSACRAWDSQDRRGRGTFGFRVCYFPK